MSLKHFLAIIKMRWQLGRNQFNKSGRINAIISMVILVLAVLFSVSTTAFAILGGTWALAKAEAEPIHMMYVWDGVSLAFLFMWSIAMMVELQRTEMMSLKNLLHLPVSLVGAFFLNYGSSLFSFTILLVLPMMLGLCTASAMYFGGAASITFALLVAFIFMVTAVSYQLRGWLGRMMENKRTRGTVITVTTIFFVLVMQLPQFITMKSIGSGSNERREIRKSYDDDIAALQEQVAANELSANEYTELATTRQETFKAERQAFFDANAAASHRFTRKINTFVPPGWLALGATDAAAGKIGIPLLCVFGMAAIGTVSLALSYRSTLRVYTGTHNKDFRETVASKKTSATEGTPLDRDLPLLTGQQSTMTLASFRSMLRAPEAKMALLTPLIMMVVFGSLMLTGKMNRFPAVGRPMVGVGAIGMALLGMIQILLNMFGLDRQGFRAYVLMPIPRRDVLLGKNLGVFPIGAALTIPLIVFSAVVFGMQPTHLLATLLQIPIVYFIFFTVTNYISIAAPIGIASGSMKPTTMNFKVVMMQLLGTLLMPAAFIPAILALGTEILAVEFGTLGTWPWFLIITIVEFPIALLYYRMMLNLLGRYLSEREQAILEVISQVKD